MTETHILQYYLSLINTNSHSACFTDTVLGNMTTSLTVEWVRERTTPEMLPNGVHCDISSGECDPLFEHFLVHPK